MPQATPNSDPLNIYGMHKVLAEQSLTIFGLNASLLNPISRKELNQPALRPLNAGMTCHKAQGVLHFEIIEYLPGLTLFENIFNNSSQQSI